MNDLHGWTPIRVSQHQGGSLTGWCLNLGIPVTAVADSYTAAENTALTVAAPGVLANDGGSPAPTVTSYDTTSAHGGTVSMASNGGFTYTPAASFLGDDTFTYTASNGGTSVGTVTIHVTQIPVVTGATLSRQQGSTAAGSTIATVSDAETPAGALTIATGSSTGISLTGVTNTAGTVTATVGATCTATTGAHTVSVQATDSDNFTGTGTLTVNVTANTAPTLSYGSLATNVGTPVTGDPLTGPSDNGSVTALAVQSVAPSAGGVTVDGPATGTPGRIHVDGSVAAGSYTVTVRATDNCGQITDVPVTLSVNDAPTVNAGPDDTTRLIFGPYTLAGTASDDGLAPGTGLVTTWSQVSGPGTTTFDDAHSLTAAATFDVGGVYVLQLSATDGQLTSTDTVQITVQSQPTITVPSDITVGEASPGAGANVAFTVTATGFPTPTISCLDGATAVSSGDHFASGSHTIVCEADNVAGTDSGSFTITVTSGPVLTVPADITVNESAPGAGRSVPFSVTATGVPTPVIACVEGATTVASGDTFAVGTHTISCTASSTSGTDTKTFHIVVRSLPVISVPADFSVLENPAGSGHAAVPFTVTATGYPTPTIACVEGATAVASGDTFTTGAHTISCTATNGAGTDTGSFVLTVRAGPVLTVPSAITVTEASLGSGAAVPFTVTATGVPTPTVVCLDGAVTVSSGDTFASGVHTIACSATNTVGADTKSFTITVRSVPVLTVPAGFTAVEAPVGSGTASVPFATTATGTPLPTTVCSIAAVLVLSPVSLTIGAHQVDCVATNSVGTDTRSFTITVVPGNHAPLAVAGGPYTVLEGQPLTLNASGSSDADGDPLSYSWDVNGDGTFGDATGVSPTLTWAQLTALGITDGPATFAVTVRVDDAKSAPVVSAAVGLTVLDAAPSGSITGSPQWTTGLAVSLVFGATDPSATDAAAGFGYIVHWGDGAVTGPVHSGATLAKTHTYAHPGGYTVTLDVLDKDGVAGAQVTRTLTVAAVAPDVCGKGRTLLVGGTPGNDVIAITAGTTSKTVRVVVNGVAEPVAVGFTRVVVDAGAGNDRVTFTGGPAVSRIVYGGAGDDVLSSGNGPAVLVGGPGRDVLTGGTQRDVLIGGAGADIETGGGGDDILLDGATAFDEPTTASEKALCGIQAEWTRTDVSFAGRISHLLGHGHGSKAGTHFVLSGRHRNVFSGGDKDVLDAGTGLNWFLCNAKGKGVLDTIVHRRSTDVVTDL